MSPVDRKKPEDARHRGLGRGLSALIGEEAPIASENDPRPQRTLPVAWLQPNPLQPRKHFAPEELQELAASIREKGILQPILVRPTTRGPEIFEIVAGERRWRAAQLAKLHDVPVVVRELSDAASLELAIVENVQRADLNAMEEAAAYQELIDRFSYTQEKLAQEVGKSRSHVANSVRLLKLPATVQAFIREGKLTAGHARTLIGHPEPELRAKEIIKNSLNVRQAEQRSRKAKPPRSDAQTSGSADVKALEKSLSNMLGLKIQIIHKGSTGELRISYLTLEQLDDVIQRLSR